MDLMYYDRQGNPLSDAMKWSRLHADMEYKRVASTTIPETDVWVSTVWLGLDHSFSFGHEAHVPIIFETMVFSDTRDVDEHMDRYATEEEALEGHLRIVAEVAVMLGVTTPLNASTIPLNDEPPPVGSDT